MKKVFFIQNENKFLNPGWSEMYFSNSIIGAMQFNSSKEAKEFIKEKNVIGKVKSMSFEEFIELSFLHYCMYVAGDRYGQVGCIDIHRIWGKNTEAVKQWNTIYKVFEIGLYGGQFGSYHGIMGLSGVLDNDLKDRCKKAFVNSTNYKNAMSSH